MVTTFEALDALNRDRFWNQAAAAAAAQRSLSANGRAERAEREASLDRALDGV